MRSWWDHRNWRHQKTTPFSYHFLGWKNKDVLHMGYVLLCFFLKSSIFPIEKKSNSKLSHTYIWFTRDKSSSRSVTDVTVTDVTFWHAISIIVSKQFNLGFSPKIWVVTLEISPKCWIYRKCNDNLCFRGDSRYIYPYTKNVVIFSQKSVFSIFLENYQFYWKLCKYRKKEHKKCNNFHILTFSVAAICSEIYRKFDFRHWFWVHGIDHIHEPIPSLPTP